MGYIVQYWDGSRESKEYDSAKEALKAAKLGLRDWMNNDDSLSTTTYIGKDSYVVFVVGGSEGPTDACATIRKK